MHRGTKSLGFAAADPKRERRVVDSREAEDGTARVVGSKHAIIFILLVFSTTIFIEALGQ